MNETPLPFGQLIRNARMRLGIDQAELARLLGKKKSEVNRVEGSESLHEDTMREYAKALGVDILFIFTSVDLAPGA